MGKNRLKTSLRLCFTLMLLGVGVECLAQGEPPLICADTALGTPFETDCTALRQRLVKSGVPPALHGDYEALFPPVTVTPQQDSSIKVLSFNVGGSQVQLNHSFQFEPVCPGYKLCNPDAGKRIGEHLKRTLPDVIFFQEPQSREQLLGAGMEAPILPEGYEVVCTFGALGFHEVCLSWNTQKLTLEGKCRSVFALDGGAVLCPLRKSGELIQFVSLHPSAWEAVDRAAVLQATWVKLIDRAYPTIVGGDFNVEKGTFGFDSVLPYPAEFSTVFGYHQEGYGRRKPALSFFGNFMNDSEGHPVPVERNSTVLRERIDQIFSNFGDWDSTPDVEQPCQNYVCLGGVDSNDPWSAVWRFFPILGPDVDHRPVLAKIRWSHWSSALRALRSDVQGLRIPRR